MHRHIALCSQCNLRNVRRHWTEELKAKVEAVKATCLTEFIADGDIADLTFKNGGITPSRDRGDAKKLASHRATDMSNPKQKSKYQRAAGIAVHMAHRPPD
jgi:hypothetical protein